MRRFIIALLLLFIAFLAFMWLFKPLRLEERAGQLRAERLEPRFERLKALEKPWIDPDPAKPLPPRSRPGATFAEYRKSDPQRPSPQRRAVDLQPIGELSPEQRAALAATQEFLRRLSGLDVRLHDPLPLAAADLGMRMNAGRAQIRSRALTHKFAGAVAQDSLGLMLVTAVGLYPEASWNYVFWDADDDAPVTAGSLQELAGAALLARTLKIETQQLLTLLGMPRCLAYECMNNASDGLDDLDRQPLHLCAATLQQLCWNVGCDSARTLAATSAFLREHGLSDAWYEKALPLVSQP